MKLLAWLLTKDKVRRKKYNVVRIRGPQTARFKSKSADIILLRVWGSTYPTLDGKALTERTMTHITEAVELVADNQTVLDTLMIVDGQQVN